jgi:hypothetical protein
VPQWDSAGRNNNWAADGRNGAMSEPHTAGRWPPNVVLTHSADCEQVGTRRVKTGTAVRRNGVEAGEGWGTFGKVEGDSAGYADADGLETVQAWHCAAGCPVAELDAQSGGHSFNPAGQYGSNHDDYQPSKIYGGGDGYPKAGQPVVGYGDTGGASRFFPTFKYQAKAGTAERPYEVDGEGRKIAHPTCKPLALMQWLCRLVLAPGATCLDPFAGSGTTGEACLLENMRCVIIEQDAEYIGLIEQRLSKPMQAGMF